ncbi:hypothetical protein [Mariniblastus fucicola]|nr:hypothetical protein [Mariniblastus fucicola]
MEPNSTPILFCIFNRPELTARVFRSIRERRPATLYIASDGPRALHPGDDAKVAAAREIVSEIDWPCEVRTRFLQNNLGCKHAISSAVSWAFEQSEELIILEDDCLPDPSFYGYCSNLLDRYRDVEKVMMVSGNNFQRSRRSDASYYFSRWTHIWGWATWKRAWQHFDVDVSSWPQLKRSRQLQAIFPDSAEYAHWSRTLDMQHAGEIDTWDFPWAYAVWANNGLSILPEKNLVTNIGFGSDATHTIDPESKLADIPACDLGPMLHPIDIVVNEAADRYTWKTVFRPTAEGAKPRVPYWKKLGLFRRRPRKKNTDAA